MDRPRPNDIDPETPRDKMGKAEMEVHLTAMDFRKNSVKDNRYWLNRVINFQESSILQIQKLRIESALQEHELKWASFRSWLALALSVAGLASSWAQHIWHTAGKP